jgi:hypothetical protein
MTVGIAPEHNLKMKMKRAEEKRLLIRLSEDVEIVICRHGRIQDRVG